MSTTATADSSTTTSRMKMRLKHKIMLVLTCLVLIGMLHTGFVFVMIALLPTIVVYYTDVTKERYSFKTIFASNLTGLLPSLGRLLKAGGSSTALQATMTDVTTWLVVYGAAMVGWLLIELCPMLAQATIVGMHQTQIGRLRRAQRRIASEWGPEVRQLSEQEEEFAQAEAHSPKK